MKKEIYLAVFLGLSGGAVMALFTVFLPTLLKNVPQVKPKKEAVAVISPTLSPSPDPDTDDIIVIENPADGEILSDNKVRINGKTKDGSLVVLETSDVIDTSEATDDGKFVFELVLNPGVNRIKLIAYLQENKPYEKILNIFYSTEKL